MKKGVAAAIILAPVIVIGILMYYSYNKLMINKVNTVLQHMPEDMESFNETVKAIRIKDAYWSGDSRIPENHRDKILKDEFVLVLDSDTYKDWKVEKIQTELGDFQKHCDKEFFLVAEGYERIKAFLPENSGLGITGINGEFIIDWQVIVGKEVEKMKPGVKYKVVPRNRSKYKWDIPEGVTVIKSY